MLIFVREYIKNNLKNHIIVPRDWIEGSWNLHPWKIITPRDFYIHAYTSLVCLPDIALNSLRPRQHGRHFADDIVKRIFLNENFRISIKISLKFVPKGSVNNILALVQIMAWRRPGDKPLSEPMMVNLLTHICVTRPHSLVLREYSDFKTRGPFINMD